VACAHTHVEHKHVCVPRALTVERKQVQVCSCRSAAARTRHVPHAGVPAHVMLREGLCAQHALHEQVRVGAEGCVVTQVMGQLGTACRG